ncbi:MAG: 50S ribosomal protein L5 [Candidatus Poseidoniaceae archaeon]|jgi:large subunit ribosomal protein L5|nr:50S ribosomal protein L5 [Candidatus Poseidoniaceae archaeon]MDP7203674.1 50S ribosomal protein L5 [Candidatus Poseidoniaceae archaeon]|tara:strand:- start:1120 stop:1647 length:528 start_codon:yes stop_codon:yes gene_type:complete
MSEDSNPMLEPRIAKVSVNIGVGEGGERLQTAERVLELLTGSSPIRTMGRIQNRDLKVRKGFPIGCKVTIRDSETIDKFLRDAFWVRENSIPGWNFDAQGNLSFGIRDYTDFPDQKYDPDIGIYGMDINVVLERPGHRVRRRRRRSRKVGSEHGVSPEESRKWFADTFGLTIMEE